MEFSPLRFLDLDVSLMLADQVRISQEDEARKFYEIVYYHAEYNNLNQDNHNLMSRVFDEVYYKESLHSDSFSDKVKTSENKEEIDYDTFYSGYADFNKEQKPLLISQRKFFLEFALKYFSLKKLNFQKDIIILQDEITKLSKLESSFILAAFFIQFIIFLLVQFFEITIEQGNIGRRKKK